MLRPAVGEITWLLITIVSSTPRVGEPEIPPSESRKVHRFSTENQTLYGHIHRKRTGCQQNAGSVLFVYFSDQLVEFLSELLVIVVFRIDLRYGVYDGRMVLAPKLRTDLGG